MAFVAKNKILLYIDMFSVETTQTEERGCSLKIRRPDNQEKVDILVEQALMSACSVLLAAKLKEQRVISRSQALAHAREYCENLSIPLSDESFSEAFDTAWGEISTFSPSKGDRLALLEKEESGLRDHKRFHNYVVTIISFLNHTDKDLSLDHAVQMAGGVRTKSKLDAFELAFDFLHVTLKEED